MDVRINNKCINCGACAVVCDVKAISQPEKSRSKKQLNKIFSSVHFFIVPQICNLCKGLDSLQCVEICPMNAIKSV